jgi:hypothetical protein
LHLLSQKYVAATIDGIYPLFSFSERSLRLESFKWRSCLAIVRGRKLLRDKSLGVLIFAVALVAMVGYFWLLFLAPEDVVFLGKSPSEWAVIVPVLVIVYVVLFVVAWIGWALASTAPPLPVIEESSED